MTTLADMTKEELDQCRGMWAGTFSGYTGIIVYENGKQAYLIIPEYNREQTFPLDKVTPRHDMPRAWQADGTPPAGKWEHAEYVGDYKGMKDVYYFDGEPTHRRFVGEWEESWVQEKHDAG